MVAAALLSSKTDEWSTPQSHFAKWNEEFGPFDLDPCATAENAKAPKYYTREQEGLLQPWFGKVWINPPYGRGIGRWVAAAAEQTLRLGLFKALEGLELSAIPFHLPDLVVMLLPARTDTRWWHDYVIPYASEIRFIRGRLKFGGAKNSAPFPSALVIFKRQ